MVTQLRPAIINRYRQIAQVLARNGLHYFAGVLGLERFLPMSWTVFGGRKHAHHTRPESVRQALEELGTTFVKFGQILSTRPDLIPPEYQEELAKLQDQVRPVPTAAILGEVQRELGCPAEQVFAAFDPEPLASASIGQAHAATLQDGTEVVVKVRRPGAVRQVDLDVEILRGLASNVSRFSQAARQYDVVQLVDEFCETIHGELDYCNEGRNAERFAENFANQDGIHVPRIYWEYTTSSVITMERIRGMKISDLEALDAAGIDRPDLASRASRIILKMVFEDGFYHADPHPGNFFIEDGGVIGLIDFGMVGALDDATQDQLIDLALAGTSRDADRIVDAVQNLGAARHGLDRQAVRYDAARLITRYYGVTLAEVDVGRLLSELMTLARKHHLQLPGNLANLAKTLLMLEGVGRRLDPDFELSAVMAPYAVRLIDLRYNPLRRAGKFAQSGLDALWLSMELPQRLRRILNDVERGDLTVNLKHGLEPMVNRFESIANRVIIGIIAASFLNGLAVLLTVTDNPDLERWATTMFVIGFTFVIILGLWLAWSFLRSGQD